MSKLKVIGKIILSEKQHKRLRELGVSDKDIAINKPKSRNDFQEIICRIGDAEAIIVNISTNITDQVIQESKNLKSIQAWSKGLDNIDLVAAKKQELP